MQDIVECELGGDESVRHADRDTAGAFGWELLLVGSVQILRWIELLISHEVAAKGGNVSGCARVVQLNLH
jgi:hypothetical protein